MGIFGRKKSKDIIDLSDMYRRGIIKESADKEGQEILDFTANRTGRVSSQPSNSFVSNDNFDFLGSFAKASSSPESESRSITESLRMARASHRGEHAMTEVNELRLKLEDTEFKLDKLISKVQELESKLREFRI